MPEACRFTLRIAPRVAQRRSIIKMQEFNQPYPYGTKSLHRRMERQSLHAHDRVLDWTLLRQKLFLNAKGIEDDGAAWRLPSFQPLTMLTAFSISTVAIFSDSQTTAYQCAFVLIILAILDHFAGYSASLPTRRAQSAQPGTSQLDPHLDGPIDFGSEVLLQWS